MHGDEQILIGVSQIRPVLGGVGDATILKYIREYPTIPIKKIGGQWTAHRGELRRWWRYFCTDNLSEYSPLLVSSPKEAQRSSKMPKIATKTRK